MSTIFDKAACEIIGGAAECRFRETERMCPRCGKMLEVYYCENRTFAVRCTRCETITLVVAENPDRAASKVGSVVEVTQLRGFKPRLMSLDDVISYARKPTKLPLLWEDRDGGTYYTQANELLRGVDLDIPADMKRLEEVYNRAYRLWHVIWREPSDEERAAVPWEV